MIEELYWAEELKQPTFKDGEELAKKATKICKTLLHLRLLYNGKVYFSRGTFGSPMARIESSTTPSTLEKAAKPIVGGGHGFDTRFYISQIAASRGGSCGNRWFWRSEFAGSQYEEEINNYKKAKKTFLSNFSRKKVEAKDIDHILLVNGPGGAEHFSDIIISLGKQPPEYKIPNSRIEKLKQFMGSYPYRTTPLMERLFPIDSEQKGHLKLYTGKDILIHKN